MLQTAVVVDSTLLPGYTPIARATATNCHQHRQLKLRRRQQHHALLTLSMILPTMLLILLLPSSATSFSSFGFTASRYRSTDPQARECGSIDVRNECQSLEQLNGCTVIKGYLIIVLLPKVNNNNTRETCDYQKYQFTRLREITDYLLFFDVKGLKSIRDMFPSLTVIRGRRLFLNYALSISGMPDLELIEFRSLVAIQRGNVYIGSCPNLCNLDKINWDRLTLSPGENHIYPEKPERCLATNDCKGCDSGYCWSNFVCQKFENTNMANFVQGPHDCHAECLGGCFKNNNTSEGCVVCRGLTDHGSCTEQCSEDKYQMEHFQRCHTRQECVETLESYTYESTCVSECPFGFLPDEQSLECVACDEGDTCIKYCNPHIANDAITVNNLADADQLQGCQILNGSLVIAIRNVVNERDLLRSLGSLREIIGHLKVTRSPHLTSLKFLQNLEKISGDPLENDLYAIIIYDNENLKELWNTEHLELDRGGMYVHLNNKLCNRYLREFRDKVVHDRIKDSLQTSDQEVLCDPAKLLLEVQVLSHNSLKFAWNKEQTSDETEILYRPILAGEKFDEDSELDSNVCTRIYWKRRLVFRSELRDNGTHYSITITGLAQYTQYACLLKTFGSNGQKNARSLLQLVRTKPDKPTPPAINISKRTDTSLTLQLLPQNSSLEVVDYYRLDVFEHADEQQLLDQRNYCEQPPLLYQDASNRNEDYDDCCARQEEEAEDRLFMQSMRQQFACSLNSHENCVATDVSEIPEAQKPLQSLLLKSNETTYTLHHLERFRLYTLQLQSCNNAVGCGAYSLLSDRTNYSTLADKLDDLQACRIPTTTEYHVHFTEPKHPNGLIVSYVIHYRLYIPGVNALKSHLICVTRLQHAESKYGHVENLNSSFNEVAVRVHSLAGDVLSQWVNVTECPATTTTRLAGLGLTVARGQNQGVNIFLVFFLVGAGGTVLWICYKRRCWRKLPELGRYFSLPPYWRLTATAETNVEDRQILVDGFETVRFHNNGDDEQKYLD